jgi:hypothetical protein
MTIIIPVYKLYDYRFNNFCFLVNNLKNINCEVIVCEQESDFTFYTTKLLDSHKQIKHIVLKSEYSFFNKSKLINTAVSKSTEDYIWMIDIDFYSNFDFIIKEINKNKNIDLYRPFNKIVHLNELETNKLIETKKINLQQDKYKVNNEYGKYSFIVKRDLFNKVGGFNEEFKGWGFQDVDFIQNRLGENIIKDYIDTQAYHLYHPVASRQFSNNNRKIYEKILNIKQNSLTKNEVLSEFSSTDTDIKVVSSFKNLEPKNKKIEPDLSSLKIIKVNEENITWKKPTTGIVCVSYLDDIKLENKNIKKIEISEINKLIHTNRGMQKTKVKKTYLEYYFRYIVFNYNTLTDEDVILLANNQFAKSKKHTTELEKAIDELSTEIIHLHKNGVQSIFDISNTQSTTIDNRGCILLSTETLFKNKLSYYEKIYNNLSILSFEEQLKLCKNTINFFI